MTSGVTAARISSSRRRPSWPGGTQPAAVLGLHGLARVGAGEGVAQDAVADAPLLQGVELDRDVVGDGVVLGQHRHVEALAQERLDRVGQEGDQVGQRHLVGGDGVERPVEERRLAR